MNCQDISLLLDDCDVRRLTAVERRLAEAHLDRCAECALAWRAHERLLAGAVTEMPKGFPQRVWQSLRQPSVRSPSRRLFGRTALLGFVLVGAAAAMTALQLRDLAIEPPEDWTPALIDVDADPGRRADGTESPTAPVARNRVRPAAADTNETSDAAIGANGGARVEGSPRPRLAVLPTRHENASSAAVVAVNAAYDAIVGVLRSKPDLEIVELTEAQVAAAAEGAPAAAVERAPVGTEDRPAAVAHDASPLPPPAIKDRPYEGPWIFFRPAQQLDGEDLAIARRFGAEYVVRLINEAPVDSAASADGWSIDVEFRGPRGGGNAGTSGSQPSNAASFGIEIADRIYAGLFPASALEEHESLVVNVGAAESERVEALLALSRERGFSDAVVAGAVELGRSATSTESRRQVWELLGRSGHPSAVQPLIDALLFDPEAEVRREAADALFRHLDDLIVRAALEGAAIADPSPIVRLQAKWQYMTNTERRAHVAAALSDRSLTPEERMAPLRVARRAVLSFDMDLRLDDEMRSLIVEAARESTDSAVKKAAIDELFNPAASTAATGSVDPAFVDFLLETLADDELDVRAAAIRALTPHVAIPKVRGALQAARTAEADSRVRTVIDDVLTSSVAEPGARRPD